MKNQNSNVKGFKIKTMSYLMILAACVIYIFVLYETGQTLHKHHALTTATENYITCENAAVTVYKGSGFLTEQVRLYVVTADPVYAEAYFTEINQTHSRELALESLDSIQPGDEVHDYLRTAIQYSNDLIEQEIYAIKLVMTATGYDESQFAQEIQELALSPEDLALDAAAQSKKAQELVFGTGYQDTKALIESNISYSINTILDTTRGIQVNSTEALKAQLGRLRIYITFLFLMNIVIFFFITVLIVKPLQIYIKCINDNRALEVIGSYEFKYLALTYNNIYELNSANESMLRKKAERDALTGILNRGAFEQIRAGLQASPAPVSLLLIDVDKFKEVNDRYGHEMGDKVLKHVAALLTSRFRTSDYVARIGGDEFAIIISEASEEIMSVVAGKVKTLNDLLTKGENGMPSVSLSVGVALSLQGFDDTLYKKADIALYRVKKGGRCGCCFYQDDMWEDS